jgi:hypothetical protein
LNDTGLLSGLSWLSCLRTFWCLGWGWSLLGFFAATNDGEGESSGEHANSELLHDEIP